MRLAGAMPINDGEEVAEALKARAIAASSASWSGLGGRSMIMVGCAYIPTIRQSESESESKPNDLHVCLALSHCRGALVSSPHQALQVTAMYLSSLDSQPAILS